MISGASPEKTRIGGGVGPMTEDLLSRLRELNQRIANLMVRL